MPKKATNKATRKPAGTVTQPLAGVDLTALSQPGIQPPDGFKLPAVVTPGALEPPERTAAEMFEQYETPILDKVICLKPRLYMVLEQAESALKAARELAYAQSGRRERWEAVEEMIHGYNRAAQEAVTHSQKFTARGMPRPEYDELCGMDEHRPTRDHQEEWRAKCEREGIPYAPLSWNPDTFPPALMAQCMVTPELDYEDAVRIWEEWSDAQAAVLFDLCLRAQKVVY